MPAHPLALLIPLALPPTTGTAMPAQARMQSEEGRQREAAFRAALQRRSQGCGGIFGPGLRGWANSPSAPRSGRPACPCGDNAACLAWRNGDGWAADRLAERRSTPSERAWYNR